MRKNAASDAKHRKFFYVVHEIVYETLELTNMELSRTKI